MNNLVINRAQLDTHLANFRRLEAQYKIESRHDVSFGLFSKHPCQFERWIHIYFANPALFLHRPHGGKIHLRPLLVNGPDDVLLSLFLADGAANDNLELLPLLPTQKQAVNRQFIQRLQCCYANASKWINDQQDRILCTENGVSIHDNRYIQPIRNKEPTAKWKSRGGHGYGCI